MYMQRQSDDFRNAKPINLDRCYAASDRQIAITRRAHALLAAAGMDEPARKWFVITVRSGTDKAVSEELKKSGVDVWMPVVMVMPQRRGSMPNTARVPKEKLALRGYVFAKVKPTVESWSGLATVKGFMGLLGSDGRPLAIRDGAIDLFKGYLEDDPDAVAIVTNALQPGDRVAIKNGAFGSFPGKVSAVNDARGRAIVEIMIFGHVNPVHLDIAQIKKL
jgi:transcription termination/antitermination protein NusG